jgi:SAM-dependent methyltransferase
MTLHPARWQVIDVNQMTGLTLEIELSSPVRKFVQLQEQNFAIRIFFTLIPFDLMISRSTGSIPDAGSTMGFYDKHILPKVVHFTCSMKPNMYQRRKVVPMAHGVVLEIGIGSGLNLPYYDPERVTRVLGLDPSPDMTRIAETAAGAVPFDVEFIGLPGEEIPLDTDSVDTVLMTYTLCSIPDAQAALRQMARVLKPGGELVFCEHGAAPDPGVRRWQNRLNPIWSRLGGGCQLNREIPGLIEQGGFRITDMQSAYIPGWRPASFNYWGTAS